MSVPDEDAAGRGWAALKDVEVELPYSRTVGNKMLYGARDLEKATGTLYSAYGIVPRTYDFPDALDHLATLPFMSVTVEKRQFIYLTCYHDNNLDATVAVLFDPRLGR